MEAKEPIVLVLTRDEAQALTDILARVGGDDTRTRRKFADAVFVQLKALGFRWRDGGVTPASSFHFTE